MPTCAARSAGASLTPRHRDDLAARLQRLNDAQLLLGRDARAHADAGHAHAQRVVVERSQLVAAEQFATAVGQPGLACDRARSDRMVAGDHHDADARGPALGDGLGHLGAQRVGQPEQADEAEGEVVFRPGPVFALKARLGDGEHAQAVGGQRLDRCRDARTGGGVQVAKLDHGLGRALGGDHLSAARGRRPNVGHRAQRRAQRIGPCQGPVPVQVLGLCQEPGAEPVKRLFHRVEGVGHARQDGHLDQRVEGLGEVALGQRRNGHPSVQRHAAGHHLRHRHAVLGQRAGLVGAQHGGRAQCLDGVDAPRQHARA